MIISATPYRISFFGGGTDYPTWYREHGGAVLSTTINRYCNIQARYLPPFFDHKFRVVWSKIETLAQADDIDHPIVRAAIQHFGIAKGMEIHHFGDLPARSGLGSSSSFTVGILHAFYGLTGQLVGKDVLAREAITVEQEIVGELVGIQDQIAAAFGGFNRIDFDTAGSFNVSPLPISQDRLKTLNDHLVLVFTGVSRTAAEVAAKQVASFGDKEAVLKRMEAMVDDGVELLLSHRDIREFGGLLHEGWELKRSITPEISTGAVNSLYDLGRSAGAIGGKLLGAGGGGFMLFFVEPAKRESFLAQIKDYLTVPFAFEDKGSHIIYYARD